MSEHIDPVEYGELRATVARLEQDVQAANVKLDAIQATLNQARGGWKVLMAQYGFIAFLASAATWIVGHINFK